MNSANPAVRIFCSAAALSLLFFSVPVTQSQNPSSARSKCPETPRPLTRFWPTGIKPVDRGTPYFYFGTAKLSLMLELPWRVHQTNTRWFSDDIHWPAPVDLKITGHRLDPDVAFIADPRLRDSVPRFSDGPKIAREKDATGPAKVDFVLASIEFPTSGCWEITARLNEAELKFVTYVQ